MVPGITTIFLTTNGWRKPVGMAWYRQGSLRSFRICLIVGAFSFGRSGKPDLFWYLSWARLLLVSTVIPLSSLIYSLLHKIRTETTFRGPGPALVQTHWRRPDHLQFQIELIADTDRVDHLIQDPPCYISPSHLPFSDSQTPLRLSR